MHLLRPAPAPFDVEHWQTLPWGERLKFSCQAWILQGYGTPLAIYAFYGLKILIFLKAWSFFCSFTPGFGQWSQFSSWAFSPQAFQKAILWAMTFEVLGFGCGSGPLTGHYSPMFPAWRHFLRPGTTRLPLFPRLPLTRGHLRTWGDILLFLVLLFALVRCLIAPSLTTHHFLPIVILLPVIGLRDKTILLAARSEHYLSTTICFLFPNDWIAGAMAVQLAIWFWAATSKLNQHFPAVVGVMMCNSPWIPFQGWRKAMVRDFPHDLRPSRLAHFLAHQGTATEYLFPVLLAFGAGGWPTSAGLAIMLLFHGYITANIPMAVPLEWNFVVVYTGFFFFGHHADIAVWNLESPLLTTYLLLALVALPLLGNLFPKHISFLPSMRYYAGNWAFSVWLFKKDPAAHLKLERGLRKSSAWTPHQLLRFYDANTVQALMSRIPAFRAMHLHGRLLQLLLPLAVDDLDSLDSYEYVDGEVVAGMALGWNFGEGHLHQEQLLEAIQTQCAFAPGELRCLFVEAQPLFGPGHHWRLHDARLGLLQEGTTRIETLLPLQPWPVTDDETKPFPGPASTPDSP